MMLDVMHGCVSDSFLLVDLKHLYKTLLASLIYNGLTFLVGTVAKQTMNDH